MIYISWEFFLCVSHVFLLLCCTRWNLLWNARWNAVGLKVLEIPGNPEIPDKNFRKSGNLGQICTKSHNPGRIFFGFLKSVKPRKLFWVVKRPSGFLKHARNFLPLDTLKTLYTGVIEPHFRYCCSVWGYCGKTELNQLQKLQNRAARIVTNSNYDAPSKALLHKLE